MNIQHNNQFSNLIGRIVGMSYVEETGIIEIVRQVPSNAVLTTNPPQKVPDEMYRDTFMIENNRLKLINSVKAQYVPPVREQYIFPESPTKQN